MVTTTKSGSQVFDLRTPYLEQGRTTDVRANTDLLTVTVKVYAEGGENAMHCHPYEDHAFIVVEGQATFHLDTDDNARVVNKYEGVMLPKGAFYWFESSGDQNLVMIRTGANYPKPSRDACDGSEPVGRMTPGGLPIPGDSAENKTVARIERPGPGFGA
jgi:mannose-6-phosphate isomerase-like protein (cupin superfamily)